MYIYLYIHSTLAMMLQRDDADANVHYVASRRSVLQLSLKGHLSIMASLKGQLSMMATITCYLESDRVYRSKC